MNKPNTKRQVPTSPGGGVKVINGDISSAIRNWKMQLKTSGKIEELRERKEFIKPSIKRRQQIKTAAYKQSFITARDRQ